MNQGSRIPDSKIVAALASSGGEVKAAALGLGISRQALHQRLQRKPGLRPAHRFSRDEGEEIAFSILALGVCAEAGDVRAAIKLLKMREPKEPRRHQRNNFSDAEMEELIPFLGGDLAQYHEVLAECTKPEFGPLFRRRIIVEVAAACALGVIPKLVWKKLLQGWVELEFVKKVRMEKRTREQAKLKKTRG